MQRLTITIDDDLDAELDGYMRARGYDNRSEALRDLARAGLQQAALETGGEKPCVAALIYVYDHETRDLPKRLTHGFHARHDLAQATLHMHLDHDRCMEITVLKGKGADVQKFANHVIAERGVRHGHVVYLPNDAGHEHETDHGRMPRTIESASTHDDCRGSSCHLLTVGDRGTLYAHA
jgi:CopG family nickel-responsive transcriptional regulator